ncbi:hypothetical protein DB88DRAFT_485656 [Papiliotrema laurentii]|uniref:Uncharacterized protein n=1 Tax=Papiliotrema laurentii TaxID=5418 RepID=A0AAD9FTK0_PAPLA|nr:hypothetical protein DB88DRAFT_485656 [Papiliotrema laurentii]
MASPGSSEPTPGQVHGPATETSASSRQDSRHRQLVQATFWPVKFAAQSVFSRAADHNRVHPLRSRLNELENSINTFYDTYEAQLSGQTDHSARDQLLRDLESFHQELSRVRLKEEQTGTPLPTCERTCAWLERVFKIPKDVISRRTSPPDTVAALRREAKFADWEELDTSSALCATLGLLAEAVPSLASEGPATLGYSIAALGFMEAVLRACGKAGPLGVVSEYVRTHFGEPKAPSLEWWCTGPAGDEDGEGDGEAADDDKTLVGDGEDVP